MTNSNKLRARLTLTLAAIIIATPAGAIDCSEGNQRVEGNLISTPYCQDEYLAEVARDYGIDATGSKIRNDPNYKKEVCRTVYTDIRVQLNCLDAGIPEGRVEP